MQNSKLIKILRLLSEEEMRQLKKLVQSPCYTSNTNLLKLYGVLLKAHPEFERGMEKEKIFKKIFPKHEFSDSKWRNLTKDMTQLVEQFLIKKELEKDGIQKRKLLLKILGERRNAELFGKEENKITKTLKEDAFRDHIYFRDLLDVNGLRLDHIESQNIRLRAEQLQDRLHLLEMYYQVSKTKIEMELTSFSRIIKLEERSSTPMAKNLMLDICNKAQALYAEDDLVTFEELKSLFFENLSSLRKSMQQAILTLLINFVIRKMKEDDLKFNQLAFELYKEGIEKEILFEAQKMTGTGFMNIVVASAKSRAFEWTYNFIEQFSPYLDQEIAEDVEALSRSYLLFQEQKFEAAIQLINQNNFKHGLYKQSAKIHSLRCYFELFLKDHSYFDLLESTRANFERALYRDEQILKENKEGMLNFSAFLRILASEKLKGNLDQATKNRLLNLLETYKTIYSRSWLKGKIEI